MREVIQAVDKNASVVYGEQVSYVQRLTKDIKEALTKIGVNEARFLVDTYYQIQHDRISVESRLRALADANEPGALLSWLHRNYDILEKQIKLSLDKYTDHFDAGEWAKSQIGIGPVITAGLIAHIAPEKCARAGAIWKYAGLAPEYVWEKGTKRPWNAKLKSLCAYKMGESFVKTSNHPEAYYGKLYKKRKELEIIRNEKGEFAHIAAAKLEKFKYGKDTEAYKAYSQGKLPAAHLHARARRVAVKVFLSHFCQVYYETTMGQPIPPVFVIDHLEEEHEFLIPPGYLPLAA
jgi:hypothetical protein